MRWRWSAISSAAQRRPATWPGVITAVAAAVEYGAQPPAKRLYHLAGQDAMSWFEFARAVFDASDRCHGVAVRPITTAEFPTRADRPANSRLDSSAVLFDLGVSLPPVGQSIANVVHELEAPDRLSRPS